LNQLAVSTAKYLAGSRDYFTILREDWNCNSAEGRHHGCHKLCLAGGGQSEVRSALRPITETGDVPTITPGTFNVKRKTRRDGEIEEENPKKPEVESG
jgi:hypothetical protein